MTAWRLVFCSILITTPLLSADSGSPLLGTPREDSTDVNWRGVLLQSGFFLGIEHGFRFATEPGTREQLRGPFVKDYFRSLSGGTPHWGDTDPFLVNYVGHPMQGSVTGFIWTQNHPTESRLEFSSSPAYWRSRLKAMGWTAIYSTQFELGPISEASLGNLGSPMAPRTMGVVDLVMTPVGGFGFQVAEDMLDRYAVRWVENRTGSRPVIILARGFLNPARSFANCLRFRTPWHRDSRPGVNEITHHQQ